MGEFVLEELWLQLFGCLGEWWGHRTRLEKVMIFDCFTPSNGTPRAAGCRRYNSGVCPLARALSWITLQWEGENPQLSSDLWTGLDIWMFCWISVQSRMLSHWSPCFSLWIGQLSWLSSTGWLSGLSPTICRGDRGDRGLWTRGMMIDVSLKLSLLK
jgi:hypothetical protein